jgi:hypothetical protein
MNIMSQNIIQHDSRIEHEMHGTRGIVISVAAFARARQSMLKRAHSRLKPKLPEIREGSVKSY